jgi:hypothetical protein
MTTHRVGMAAFEEFVAKQPRPPDYLRAEAPTPNTWDGTDDEWQELKRIAREGVRVLAANSFVELIANRGYYPDEVVTQQLRPGATVGLIDGTVRRPPVTSVPDQVSTAQDVITQLRSHPKAWRDFAAHTRADLETIS